MSQRQAKQQAAEQAAEGSHARVSAAPASEGGAMETVAGAGVGELQRLYPAQQQQVVMRANQVHGMRHVQRMLEPGHAMVMRRDDEGEQGAGELQTEEEEEKRRKEGQKELVEAMKGVQLILLPLQEQVQASLGGTREEVQAQIALLTAQVTESEGALARLEAVKAEYADVITPEMLEPSAEFEERLASVRLNLQAASQSLTFEATLLGIEQESDALLSRVDDEVQEALDALAGRVEPIRADFTGVMSAAQQPQQPSASLRERLTALQSRVEALERNIQSMRDLLAGQNLVTFTEEEGQDWTWEERVVIYQQAQDVAASLAEAYNSYAQTRAANDPAYQYQALTPEQAYLAFFDGNLTFNRSASRPTNDSGQEYYGGYVGNRTIDVYAGADADYIPDNPRFITHEMGHALEAAINSRLGGGLVRNLIDGERGDTLPDDRSGFAGALWDWQYSYEAGSGEHFADMVIGWVFGRWGQNEDETLTDAGAQRDAFMDQYMPQWVGQVIDNVLTARTLEPTTTGNQGVNLRGSPDGPVIAGLPANSEVRPTGVVEGDWVQVYGPNSQLGWVHRSLLPDWEAPETEGASEEAPTEEAPAEESPTGEGAIPLQGSATINIRSTPGTAGGQATVMVSLTPGTPVTPTGTTREVEGEVWFEVTTPANGTGWVRCDFINRC